MGVQDVVRWLLPKEDRFFELMEQQAVVLHKGATELGRFKSGGPSAADIAKSVQEIEHEGDALLHAVEEALAKTFVTPIDREDIQKLAGEIDDILDLINNTARSMSLYNVEAPTVAMTKLMALLESCALQLKDALPHLRGAAYDKLMQSSRDVKKLEKEGDTLFRDAVAQLFRDSEIDAKTLLRDKEILEHLEDAIDACEDTAEFLAHLAVKNG
jgi:uncharacterized protein